MSGPPFGRKPHVAAQRGRAIGAWLAGLAVCLLAGWGLWRWAAGPPGASGARAPFVVATGFGLPGQDEDEVAESPAVVASAAAQIEADTRLVPLGQRRLSPYAWPAVERPPACAPASSASAASAAGSALESAGMQPAGAADGAGHRAGVQVDEATSAALLDQTDPAMHAAGLLLVGRRDELVTAALASEDPRLHLLAVQGCEAAREQGEAVPAGCSQLTAGRRTRLEPDNAAAWIDAAGEAERRGDEAAVVNALFQAAQTDYSNVYPTMLPALVQGGWAGSRTVAQRDSDLRAATEVSADATLRSVAPLRTLCGEEAMADANRAQVCERLGRLLLGSGSSLLEAYAGMEIGLNAGWDTETLAATRAEIEALSRAALAGLRPPGTDECHRQLRMQRFMMSAARRSEWAALETAARRSGRDFDQWRDEARRSALGGDAPAAE